MGPDSDEDFCPECPNQYEYVLYAKNVDCHKVDYENPQECELLDAEEGEGECLVPADTHFRIASVSSEDDFSEMGFYEVYLEKI